MAEMAAIAKICVSCKSELPKDAKTVQCDKCVKNEIKYGKPTTCKFCHIPAAFSDQMCVYCCHSERKFGPPVACASCMNKSAFTRNIKKPTLCRLCIMTARREGKREVGGVAVPREKEERRSDVHHLKHKPVTPHQKKRSHEEKDKKDESTPSKHARSGETSGMEFGGTNVLQMQKIQQKNDELQRQNDELKKAVQEKDRQLSALRAEFSSTDRKWRDMISQLEKDKEEAISNIHVKYKEQNKQGRQQKAEQERLALREKEKKEREKREKAEAKKKIELDIKRAEKLKDAKEKESDESKENEKEKRDGSVKSEKSDTVEHENSQSPSDKTVEDGESGDGEGKENPSLLTSA